MKPIDDAHPAARGRHHDTDEEGAKQASNGHEEMMEEASNTKMPTPAGAATTIHTTLIRPATTRAPREELSSAAPTSSGHAAAAAAAAAAASTERRTATKSALRRRPSSTPVGGGCPEFGIHHRPRSERRVRGLWTNETPSNEQGSNLFARLHEDTLVRIFSNLDLLDAHRSSRVCQRWKHLLSSNERKRSIRHVDATEFVRHVYDRCATSTSNAPATTTQAVERHISQYRPDRLTIRDIGMRLSSEFCVPNVHRLVELTLTHYEELTDLSLHAMLLLTAATSSNDPGVLQEHGRVQRMSGTSLQILRLEHCPQLTDAAVRSVALTCPNLHVLSLRGCHAIKSIVPLRPLWKMTTTTTTSPAPVIATSPKGPLTPPSKVKQIGSASASAPLSLASLFVATNNAAAAHPPRRGRSRPTDLESVFSVPPPPSPTSVATIVSEGEDDEQPEGPELEWDGAIRTPALPPRLAQLFAAPAPAPGFRSFGDTSATMDITPLLPGPRCGGALIDLDVSDTGVTPTALLDALRSARALPTTVMPVAPTTIHLERLMASCGSTRSGDDQLWMPHQLKELANLLDAAVLKETDVGILETISSYDPPLHYRERLAYPGVHSH